MELFLETETLTKNKTGLQSISLHGGDDFAVFLILTAEFICRSICWYASSVGILHIPVSFIIAAWF